MVLYICVAVLGLAITLVGTVMAVYWLIPIGMAVLIGGFFWFARQRQATPVVSNDEDRTVPRG